MIRSTLPFLFLAIFLASSTAAHGELRISYEDATVAQRSELIVTGRLNGESIRQVMHERGPNEGCSWEYHATLVITEILKGKASGEEIPIVIHYGLTPTRLIVQHGLSPDSPREEVGPIGMYDSGNSIVSFSPLIEDVEAENLWFLRRRSGRYGNEPGAGSFGIVDPEDVQPIQWRDYFLAYLAPDPEKAMREYAQRNPQTSYRAQQYLGSLDLQRLLKTEESRDRCEKLILSFVSGAGWIGNWEARTALINCAPLAGARLKEVFLDPERRHNRQEIFRLWKDMDYQEAVPILIKSLKKLNRSISAKGLEREHPGFEPSEEYDASFEVSNLVEALRAFQDPRAKAVLEDTHNLWKASQYGERIVKECEEALRTFSSLP